MTMGIDATPTPGLWKVRLTCREAQALGVFQETTLEVLAASQGEASFAAIGLANSLGFEVGVVLAARWLRQGEEETISAFSK